MLCLRKLTNLIKTNRFGSVKWLSSQKREFKEVEIKVPWGNVAGKWWEPYDTRPILTVHGWQDNCGGFDRLIPLLDKNVGFLAIDLPGHGYSSRLPEGMMYHIYNYILTIRTIAKELNWPSVSLMGHSLGSILCFTYSMLFHTETDLLICIDALKPMVSSKKHTLMAEALDLFLKYNKHAIDPNEPPSYTVDEMVELIKKPNDNSILPEYTYYIMDRNVAPSKLFPGKYYFTRDPRVKTGAIASFCQDELVKSANNMKMPVFVVKADKSSYFERKENFYEVLEVLKKASVDCQFHRVQGTHHFFLNYPETVSGLINQFINTHNKQNRNIGGIRDDIITTNKPSYFFKETSEMS